MQGSGYTARMEVFYNCGHILLMLDGVLLVLCTYQHWNYIIIDYIIKLSLLEKEIHKIRSSFL